MATLGISTNTRLLGLAIITDGELQEYKVLLHKSSWTPWKVSQIILSLEACAQQYSINRVILSMPPTHCQTKEFTYLVAQIRDHFRRKHLLFERQSVQALHAFCSEQQRKTKKNIMRAIAERFPELRTFYEKELRNKNKYYVKLFEAVGIAALQEHV